MTLTMLDMLARGRVYDLEQVLLGCARARLSSAQRTLRQVEKRSREFPGWSYALRMAQRIAMEKAWVAFADCGRISNRLRRLLRRGVPG